MRRVAADPVGAVVAHRLAALGLEGAVDEVDVASSPSVTPDGGRLMHSKPMRGCDVRKWQPSKRMSCTVPPASTMLTPFTGPDVDGAVAEDDVVAGPVDGEHAARATSAAR